MRAAMAGIDDERGYQFNGTVVTLLKRVGRLAKRNANVAVSQYLASWAIWIAAQLDGPAPW